MNLDNTRSKLSFYFVSLPTGGDTAAKTLNGWQSSISFLNLARILTSKESVYVCVTRGSDNLYRREKNDNQRNFVARLNRIERE